MKKIQRIPNGFTSAGFCTVHKPGLTMTQLNPIIYLDTLVGMSNLGELRWINLPRGIGFEVPRSRLLERLQQHVNCRVRVIVAPSGYGKTTLVAQFLRETRAQVVWLEAVPDDAEVLHFAKSLQLAMSQISSESSQSEWLKLLETTPSTNALGAALKRDIRSYQSLELVIDNTEHLSQESRLWLSDLLEADLGAARIWLIGYDLEHLRLARLVARSAAIILTQHDLRFDTDETQRVLEASHSIENPEEVCSRLDGWCAGVGLIAAGVSPHITPTNLIFDAISQLPKNLRERLPEAAVLEVWNENLAQELGCDLPNGWLNSIRRSGLPLSQISPDIYRPHRTLLEALEQQLQLNALRHQTLHNAAAESLLKRQESLGAIRHFLIAANREAAIRAAEPFVLRLSARGEHGLVCNMLQEISEPRSATLSGLLGIALIETGKTEQGEQLLNALESDQITPSAMFALGKLALRRGESQTALDCAIQGQRLDGTPLELGRCRRLEGWALKNLGRLEEAQERAELEVARAEANQNLEELAAALFLFDAILATVGKYRQREEILHRAIRVYDELNNPIDAASVRNNLANVYRLQGKFEAALLELERAIKDVENLENEALPFLLETFGDVQIWQGQREQASNTYRRAIGVAQRLGFATIVPRMQCKLVGAMLHADEHQQALALLKVIQTHEDLDGLHTFTQGLALFETQPEQAKQAFLSATKPSESEWAVRISLLQAELARRFAQLERHHADAVKEALTAHGFEAAAFVDTHLTAPTLRLFMKSGWLPPSLFKRINQLSNTPALANRINLEIQSLGARKVTIDDLSVTIHLAKSFETLVFLARNGPSSREAILEAIWNSDTPQSQRYFKVAIRRLRVDLGEHPAVTFDPIPFQDVYAIASQFNTQLDLNQLELSIKNPSDTTLEPTLSKVLGEFLPDASGEWVDEQRELSLEYNLIGNIKLGGSYLEHEPTRAAAAFRRALVLDPFNAECLIQLVCALLALQDRLEAKHVIERFQANLKRELNVNLDQSTRERLESLGL
jgi:LuxR family transcriptional regulator, maltose regulon positive regulatory protein